ncbi:cytochrome P450 [Mycobacterium sp. 236(2023)]|uniref:cytochrome P450 n=1 Tax=Mycobacterium sp. 236(2023) TaxID=3038163 RepID=UPI00241586EE|nr:cytochrome P450 [Mycobacterium sp. 236(2023)]MDG4668105.1 cytochrome P450 [Mycobacterium sp. 236(2023)]
MTVTFNELLATPPDFVHQAYGHLRESGDGTDIDADTGVAFVTRYADVSRILKDAGTYSSKVLVPPTPLVEHDPNDPAQLKAFEHIRRFPQFQDPPVHTRLRNLARHTFTPRSIGRLREAVDTVTEEIFTKLDHGQELDFVTDIAEKLPVWIIAHAMGFPVADRQQLRLWTMAVGTALDPAVTGAQRRDALRGTAEFIDYLEDLVANRRRDLGDDLISILVAAQGNGELESQAALVGTIVVLLAAGNITTADLLSNGMKLFLDHPDQYEMLVENPDLVNAAIEEVLRFEPSLKWDVRVVTERDQVGNHEFAPGTFVMLGIAAANRDPRRFDDADRFNILRTNNQHLAFGAGVHYCIGAPLSRLEADVFFRQMIARFPRLPKLNGELSYANDFAARSIRRFPIRLN